MCSTFCPAGQLCLDCSAFVDVALRCAGLSSPGGSTGSIFAGSGGGEAIDPTTITTQSDGTPVINGKPLHNGDLVGWLAGENGDSTGHVLIYSGGQLYDSHGGNNGRLEGGATGAWPFSKYQSKLLHLYRTTQ